MTTKTFYSNEDMMVGLDSIVQNMKNDNWTPDVIVGILRGGIIPAVYISHMFNNTPLVSMEWSLRDIAVGKKIPSELDGYLFSDSKILLVDDICDSGNTLKEVQNILVGKYQSEKYGLPGLNNIKSAVLHYNMGQDTFEPNYCHIKIDKIIVNEWIVYPWELE